MTTSHLPGSANSHSANSRSLVPGSNVPSLTPSSFDYNSVFGSDIGSGINSGILPSTSNFGLSSGFFDNNIDQVIGGGVGGAVNGGGGIFPGLKSFGSGVLNNAKGIGTLLQGISSLSDLFSSGDQLDLQEDIFGFKKGLANRNLANQAKSINTQFADRQNARIGGTGDPTGQTNYLSTADYLQRNSLDGSAIA